MSSTVGSSPCSMIAQIPAPSRMRRITVSVTISIATTTKATRWRKTHAARPTGMIANGSCASRLTSFRANTSG
ncbi:MAG TPA: hypothetical protein VIN37_09090 [Candidatus Limnocylindria bacterium]